MADKNIPITVEKFAAYLDCNLSTTDMRNVFLQINENSELREIEKLSISLDDNVENCLGADNESFMFIDDFEIPDINDEHRIVSDDYFYHEPVNEKPELLGQLTPDDIQQQYPDTCAIKSQQIILESNNINITEDELVQESIVNGWYAPNQGGTNPADVGNLLENHGMTVNRYINASIEDIATELAKGHHVIVGVDSGELWQPGTWETFEDFINSSGADHALIVSGVQVNPLTAEREIILTDPGTGEIAHTYTTEQFLDAWGDSGNFMVIAE